MHYNIYQSTFIDFNFFHRDLASPLTPLTFSEPLWNPLNVEVQDPSGPGSRSWVEQTVQIPKPDFVTLMNQTTDQNRLVKDLAIAIFEAVKANHFANRVIRYTQDEHMVKIDNVRVRMAVLQANNTKMLAKISSLEMTVSELTKAMSTFFKAMYPVYKVDREDVQGAHPHIQMRPLSEETFDEALRIAQMAVDDDLVQSAEDRRDIAECLQQRNESQARLRASREGQLERSVPERVEELQREKPPISNDVFPAKTSWEKIADKVLELQGRGLVAKKVENPKFAHLEYRTGGRKISDASTVSETEGQEAEGVEAPTTSGASKGHKTKDAKTKRKSSSNRVVLDSNDEDDEALGASYSDFAESESNAKPKTKKKTTEASKTDKAKAARAKHSDQDDKSSKSKKKQDDENKKRKRISPQVEPVRKKRHSRRKEDDDDDTSSTASPPGRPPTTPTRRSPPTPTLPPRPRNQRRGPCHCRSPGAVYAYQKVKARGSFLQQKGGSPLISTSSSVLSETR